MTPFEGAVFDLDGTLVDNMGVHAQAFAAFVGAHGLPPFDEGMRARFDGKRNRDIFPTLFGRELSPEEIARFSDEKESLYRELSRGRLAPLRGIERLLAILEARGIPVAIATSAPAGNVPHTLAETGLLGRFTRVARSDAVPRGKPYPDVFLAACELMDREASRCVAFEDAPIGIIAARAAGMACVAVTTTFAPGDFAAHGAAPDAAVGDFEEYLSGPGRWLVDEPVAT
jgi:HAD superfamily hydrolase (TIGR01509 family)